MGCYLEVFHKVSLRCQRELGFSSEGSSKSSLKLCPMVGGRLQFLDSYQQEVLS